MDGRRAGVKGGEVAYRNAFERAYGRRLRARRRWAAVTGAGAGVVTGLAAVLVLIANIDT